MEELPQDIHSLQKNSLYIKHVTYIKSPYKANIHTHHWATCVNLMMSE